MLGSDFASQINNSRKKFIQEEEERYQKNIEADKIKLNEYFQTHKNTILRELSLYKIYKWSLSLSELSSIREWCKENIDTIYFIYDIQRMNRDEYTIVLQTK